ncbi:MAG: hypothetical protein K5770_09345 [Lachnospiraceae bacterium]|nr:hypothetical protein [Lachnospiraceae bacterium]
MKRLFKNKENRIVFFISLFTLIAACAPLFTRFCINGHDLEYHLLRIESLKEGILAGRPFLKVNMLFFGGAGYASSMFYPDFLLYFPAILRALGVSINLSYHAFVAFCIILCYISAYLCTEGITGSKYAGVVTGVLITLCNYHIEDIYVRSAVGEYTAFIFVPVVIYGIFDLLYREFKKPYVLGIGFSGLLLCHTGTFILCLAAALFFFLIKSGIFIKRPGLLLKLFATAVLTAGVTCFYWLPVLEQFFSARFMVSVPWIDPADETVTFAKLFYSEFPSIGPGLILIYALRIFLKKQQVSDPATKEAGSDKPVSVREAVFNKDLLSFADLLCLFAVISALSATGLFPWNRLGKYLVFLQFPWRLFIVSSVFFAMADGILIFCLASGTGSYFDVLLRDLKSGSGISGGKALQRENNAGEVINAVRNTDNENRSGQTGQEVSGKLAAAVFIIFALSAFSVMEKNDQGYYDYSDDYYSYVPYTANVIAGEWLPVTVSEPEAIVGLSGHAENDRGEEVRFDRKKNEIEFDLDNACQYVDVPFIYYEGYEAVKDDGTVLMTDGRGNNGFVRVYCAGTGSGSVTVRYAGTGLQMLSYAVSGISAVVVLLCVLFIKKKAGRTKE